MESGVICEDKVTPRVLRRGRATKSKREFLESV